MMDDKPAVTKREKISKAQRLTLVEVLGASLILGVCLVLGNFLIKYIGFNARVISAKNDGIADYDMTIRNVGACEDKDRNGRLTDSEIEKCRPNTLAMERVVNSLRYNIYEVMSRNEDLESVARKRDERGICYDDKGEAIDYTLEYKMAVTEAEKARALSGARLCSSLRVISDALPASKNTEALMASLNQLFIEAGVEPDNIAPKEEQPDELEVDGVGAIPVTFRMEGTGPEVIRVMDNIENSVRQFDLKTATVEWTSKGLSVRADAYAYYLTETFEPETTMIVRAREAQ